MENNEALLKPVLKKGIRGWLIFILLTLVIGLFQQGWLIWRDVLPNFSPEVLAYLNTDEVLRANPYLVGHLYFEVIALAAILVLILVMLITMILEHHLFPRLMMIHMGVMILYLFVDMYLQSLSPLLNQAENARGVQEYSEIVGVIIRPFIWVPYLLTSERVKLTFSKPAKTLLGDGPEDNQNTEGPTQVL